MSASPPCATPPSHVSSPSAPPIAPDTLLAAANMRRLLEVYRSLAPLTIGGPSSTSLETPGTQLPGRPPTDPRMLRKFAPYPWLMGPVFPPPPFLNNKTDPEPGPSPRKRHCSSDSGGPGGLRRPPHTASPAPPIFSPRDKESSSLRDTSLDGQTISCFSVGGEDRLCLTQLLQLVLHDIPLARIHQACDELQIFCSTCTPAQLAALKLARVLPISAAQCGLITKSDAERLCALLLQEPPSQRSPSPSSPPPPPSSPAVSPPRGDPTSFKVQHECFGDCVGIIHPQSYSNPGAKCIECCECQSYLSPQKFVCHSHSKQENRTCHWGFDSANWTAYIQVFEDYGDEEKEKYKDELNSIKKRFSHTKVKRKWIENERDEVKRSRQEEEPVPGDRRFEGAPNPGHRQPLDLSATHFPDPSHHQMSQHPVFLNPMSIPFPGHAPEKVGFPLMDPRSLYLQWATGAGTNPYLAGAGSIRPPGPLPAPYLHSLAQFHNLKALATKNFLEQQNLAKSLLQQAGSSQAVQQNINLYDPSARGRREETSSSVATSPAAAAVAALAAATAGLEDGPKLSEFVVSVSAVLETTGVDHVAKTRVMSVVNRLVDRLTRAEEEKDTANLQLKGMEEKVAKLEKELEDRIVDKNDESGEVPLYESSSDAGIESGNEVDDSLSEK